MGRDPSGLFGFGTPAKELGRGKWILGESFAVTGLSTDGEDDERCESGEFEEVEWDVEE